MLIQEFLLELETEAPATRKCLERIPESLFDWKPTDKSMKMGDLVLMIAEMPRWIQHVIEVGEIDFVTFGHAKPATTAELVKLFDENMELARKAFNNMKEEQLSETFTLKNNGQVLAAESKKTNLSSIINHYVHHRGQLTVYMRLQNIPIPSIYGPSGDDQSF